MTESNVKIGLRVVRGRDWSYEKNQDGNPPGKGTITEESTNPKWWRVEWDHDGVPGGPKINSYKVGAGGKYDLQIA